jgi:hypothetical protein
MHRDMGDRAERAVGMVRRAVGVAVRSLHSPRDHRQHDAHNREENPPRTAAAAFMLPAHT